MGEGLALSVGVGEDVCFWGALAVTVAGERVGVFRVYFDGLIWVLSVMREAVDSELAGGGKGLTGGGGDGGQR